VNSKLIIGGVVAVIIIAAAAFLLMQPPATGPEGGADDIPDYTEEVDLETRALNTNLYASLVSAGFEDPFVDIDLERAYVAYDLPEGFEAEMAQRFVIGAAADAAFDVQQIIVAQYEDEVAQTVWTVEMDDFKAFMMDELSGEELDAKIVKEAL
jgi:hypothetical protein